MRELENEAADRVVQVPGASRWERRDQGGVQMRDDDVVFADGHEEPLEVTLNAEKGVVQTWARLDRQFDAPGVSSGAGSRDQSGRWTGTGASCRWTFR